MQYKVPQNIFMEDRIVGPLTLWQFIYLLSGGLVVYIAYQFFYTSARGLFFVIAVPTTLLALGLVFVKVHEQSLGTFIKNAISFTMLPRERVWRKEESLEGKSVIVGATKKVVIAEPQAKNLQQTELAKLSEILDTYGKPSSNLPVEATTSDRSDLRRVNPLVENVGQRNTKVGP